MVKNKLEFGLGGQMNIEKIIVILVGIGMGTALIQAIFRKMLIINLWGYTTTTLHISILFLFAIPLMVYGLIRLVDKLQEQRHNAKVQTN